MKTFIDEFVKHDSLPPALIGFDDKGEHDDDIIGEWSSIPDHTEGTVIAIEYANSAGEISTRRIRLVNIDQRKAIIYVYAYCFLRKTTRSFRADRILALGVAPFGKRVNDPLKWLANLHDFKIKPKPPTRIKAKLSKNTDINDDIYVGLKAKAIFDNLRPSFVILSYLMQPDGKVVDAEHVILREFIVEITQNEYPELNELIFDLAASLYPTTTMMKLAANRVETGGYLEHFAPWIEKMIKADGVIAPEELAALKTLRTHIESKR